MKVQRLDALGTKMWGASGLLVSGTNWVVGMPKAVSDGAGGIVVGWFENHPSRTGYYVQAISRSGTPLWGAGGINLTATVNSVVLCSDAAGGAIVAWTQTVGGLVDVYANRVTSAGSVAWGAAGKLVHSSGDLKYLNFAVPSTSSGAILSWYHYTYANLSNPDTLSFQRVDGNGDPQWPTPGAPSPTRLITLDDTTIELSSQGSAGAAYFTTHRADSMFLHQIAFNGVFPSPVVGWPIIGLPTGQAMLGLAKSMIPDGSGGVVVAWRDESYSGVTARIRAQRLNTTGTRLWPTAGGTFVEVCPGSNDQSFPGLVRDLYGNFVVGWEDYRNGVHINLWAQTLEPVAGALQWPSGGVVFASAGDAQFTPVFAPGNHGNVIAGFDDARTGQERLYAQFLGPAGALTPASPVSFTTATPSPSARYGSGYATDGTLLFMHGGGGVGTPTNTLESYDPVSDTWTPLGSGYASRWWGSLAYVPETGKLYALSGTDLMSGFPASVEEIPVTGGPATLMATNPVPRYQAGAAVANGKIYVIGGFNGPLLGGRTGIVQSFDPVANTWSSHAPLPVPRSLLTATHYNGAIFAVGGPAGASPPAPASSRVDRYDIASNTWASLPDAPIPISGHASAVTGGLLWFVGDISTGWTLLSYAPATGNWTIHTTNLLSRRDAAVVGIGNRLIVTGGIFGSPARLNFETQESDVSALVAATPLASVTLPVTAAPNVIHAGDLLFAAPAESTLVTLNFGSIAGSGSATVERYPGPAAGVSFSSGTPTTVGTTRWVMSESGLSPFTATLWIQLHGLPDALGPGSGISLYHRAAPGTGAFAPITTTYDPVTHRLEATVSAVGEFILGSGGSVDVPFGGTSSLALAIRPLGEHPVRGVPSFQLTLPTAALAHFELFDLQGRKRASRALALGAGVHALRIDEIRVPRSGLYFARLSQGDDSAVTRVVVVP